MAIQYDPRLQGKQNTTDILTGQQQPTQPDAQGTPQTSPEGSPMQQPTQAPQQPTQTNLASKKPSSSSGMYTNVQKYTEKNQPAAQQMAKSIGQTVQRSADIARKNIQQTQQQFGNLMEQGSLQNRGTAVQDVTSAAQSAAGMTAPQQSTDQNQPAQQGMSDADKRLKSILDAKYTGPQQMRELGSFGETQRRAQEAGRLTKQLTGGDQGRQELLNKSLERKGSGYSQGSRRLDELLFSQGDPQKQLAQTQQQIGDVGQDLTGASQSARQSAIDRARETQDIRGQARGALQTAATGRAGEVEDYLTGQIDAGGQLADYYKNLLTGGTTFDEEGNLVDAQGEAVDASGLNLGALEASTLGVKSGAGLYNKLRDQNEREALLSAIDQRAGLDRSKLLSKDQQAQLAELQRMQQLSSDYGVADSGLDFTSKYQDPSLAGTQDATQALDTQAFRDALTGAEKTFRESAADPTTGVGKGSAKYDKGLWRTGRIKKRAYESAKLKDILQDQGYDFSDDSLENYTYDSGNANLKKLAKFSKSKSTDLSDAYGLEDAASEATNAFLFGGMASEDLMGLLGLEDFSFGNIGRGAGDTISSFGEDIGGKLIGGTIGGAIEDALGVFGTEIGNFSSGFFGGGKGKARKKATRDAKKAAVKDLKRKLEGKLNTTGFNQRVNVEDTEESQQRTRDLMDILGKIG